MAASGKLQLCVYSPWPFWPKHGVTLMLCQSWGVDSDLLSLYLIFNVPKSASLPMDFAEPFTRSCFSTPKSFTTSMLSVVGLTDLSGSLPEGTVLWFWDSGIWK